MGRRLEKQRKWRIEQGFNCLISPFQLKWIAFFAMTKLKTNLVPGLNLFLLKQTSFDSLSQLKSNSLKLIMDNITV